MTSTSARHRAPAARLSWVPRALLSLATVPVGALAGCALVAASSSTAQPELGLAGLAVVGLPLTLRGLRGRRAEGAPARGRRSARRGAPVVLAAEAPLAASAPRASGAELELAGIPAPRRAGWERTRALPEAGVALEAAPARVFAVSSGQQVVEVEPAAQRQLEIDALRQLWDSGTGPDTGGVPAVAALVPAAHAG